MFNGKTLKFRTEDGIVADGRTSEIIKHPFSVCILTTAYKYNAYGKYYTNEIRFPDEVIKLFDEETKKLVQEFSSLDEFKKYKEEFNKSCGDGRFRYQQVVYFIDEATKEINRIYLGYYSYAKFWDYMDEIKFQNKKLFSQSTKINVRSISPGVHGLTFAEGESTQNLDEIMKYKESLEDDVWSGRSAISRKVDGIVGKQKIEKEENNDCDNRDESVVCKIYVFGDSSIKNEKEIKRIIESVYKNGGYSDKKLRVNVGPLDYEECKNNKSIFQKCENSDGVIQGGHPHKIKGVGKIEKLEEKSENTFFVPKFSFRKNLKPLAKSKLEKHARELFGKLFPMS